MVGAALDRLAVGAQTLLVGGLRVALLDVQLVTPGRHVVVTAHCQNRRPRLPVPATELAEVAAAGRLHRRDEVVAGHRLAIVAAEVLVHAGAERRLADQGVDHADHFRALLVDSRRVEVVDLLIRRRADGVRHRASVLGELRCAQRAHLLNARHRPRVHVHAEFLVAEHGQALFQAELEPVAAGHAVAGPVVEILVRDHPVDVLVVGVGGHIRAGQHVLGVEDVEALVLHRPHVEVAHRDDHVVVEVHLQAEALLVPGHAQLERGHGVPALVQLAWLDVDGAAHATAAGGDEPVLQHVELRRHAGEEIGRLGEGVFPRGPVTAVGQIARADRVAVGEQLRKPRLVGFQAAGELRHHVRSVRIVGDAAKALGLALREVPILAAVQTRERGVRVRLDADHGGDARSVSGQREAQALVAERVRGGLKRDAVHRDRDQGHRLAVEP